MIEKETADRTSYYYVNGKRVELQMDPSVFAVGFRSGRKSDNQALRIAAKRLLDEDSEEVGFVAHYGLRVYRLMPSALPATAGEARRRKLVAEAVTKLNEEEPVEFAAQAVRRMGGEGNLSFVTRRFLVGFKKEVSSLKIEALNKQYNAHVIERLGYVSNGFLMEAPSAQGPEGSIALANAYYETGLCDFAHADFIERRQWRSPVEMLDKTREARWENVVSDRDGEFLERQWHLSVAKVREAWSVTNGNSSITIAVLDDGVDVGHAEFVGKLAAQYDFQTKMPDATPKTDDDKHGTACAGVATARGVRASGAAPGCCLMPVRTPTILGVADEANMFGWAKENGADIISCSWGPADNAGPYALVDNVRAAINDCVTQGRAGKGIPVFFAAGNGNESVSNDGYASNPDVMAIAASSERDTRSPYSDFGPEIFICAPSSGDSAAGDRRIFTTDRRGTAGYNVGDSTLGDSAGDYTSRFGGTSSACPLVAGVAGLILSANPSLTRDQVREILRTTADKIGGAASYDSGGHSSQFGYGRVNALAAVRKAQNGGGTPSISGPVSATRDNPPTFAVNRGNRLLYAVELTSRRELLDPDNSAQRSPSNHFGSWLQGLISDPTYRPPADVWSALAASGQVFYLAHFADDQNWTNYIASLSISQAPSVAIGSSGSGPEPSPGSSPSLSAPGTARADEPPVFQGSTGNCALFAVELATNPDLMNGDNAPQRTSSNYYGSWVEGMRPAGDYAPPGGVWSALAGGGRVYYRGHFADDAQWSNYVSWPESGALPSIQIEGVTLRASRGSVETPTEVVYPSGSVFRVVDRVLDGVDYSDPVANGIVPLIEVRGRESEKLSSNFTVGDLMAKGARYSRISPKLVEGLQAVQTRIGQPLKIDSGYRHPALNQALDGNEQSEHLTGRAATIRGASANVKPIDIAKAALKVIDDDIGLGLGPNSVHINVAGTFSTWVYEGASMSDEQFASWARGIRNNLLERSERDVAEVAVRTRPTIEGPEVMARGDAPPSFRITTGLNRYFAVEVVAHWSLFRADAVTLRTDDTFYGSWGDPRFGLIESRVGNVAVFTLPRDVWKRLGGAAATLYYRVLTASDLSPHWHNLASSSPDDEASAAPRIRLVDRLVAHDDTLMSGLALMLGLHANDDRLWDR